MVILLLISCVITALFALFAGNEKRLRTIATIGSSVVFVLTLAVTLPVLIYGPATWFDGKLRLDMFAALLFALVGFVQWTATLVSKEYIANELKENIIDVKRAKLYYALLQLFVFSMLLTLAANNIGLMWVALEGTTLATTTLVAFYHRAASLEAAWKYILLCSLGISLGLLGVFLVFFAASQTGITSFNALSWTELFARASQFSPSIMRLSFIFIFIGYGTKVGLVPMHTWLPDAHGHTPSPISGLLSGVLLNIALFAIIRFKTLTDLALGGSNWTNMFFVVFGAISFIVPAAFIIIQKDLKRLLAYSSIEHMGFIVFSFGLGAVGRIAAMIHLIGHSLTKSMLFFGSGNILQKFHSTKFEKITDVMRTLPKTTVLFFLGLLILLATPPSPLFISEFMAFSAALPIYTALAIVMLIAGTIICAGMIQHLGTMLFTKGNRESEQTSEPWQTSHNVMLLHLLVIVALGIAALHPATQSYFSRMIALL